MLNVIILAGEKTDGKPGNKALMNINGRAMIEYVIDAVKSADSIGKVVVVGPKTELEARLMDKVDSVIQSEGSIMENVAAGIDCLGVDDYVLICASDIPFITSEAINDFIARSIALKADFCYPIVDRSVSTGRYPGMERTYVKIREGFFTGGNVFYLNPKIFKKCWKITDRLVNARKSPLRMAGILGFGFVVRLLFGMLSIERAERQFSRILNISARAVVSGYPEIGNDVDKPGDAVAAAAYLGR